jgi:small subunit ribosomal protein S20
MPNHKSAWKRMRQNETRRTRNRADRTFLRNVIRSYHAQGDAAAVRESFPQVVSIIDKALKKGIIHRRKADRLKSRLSRRASTS